MSYVLARSDWLIGPNAPRELVTEARWEATLLHICDVPQAAEITRKPFNNGGLGLLSARALGENSIEMNGPPFWILRVCFDSTTLNTAV